ncbi:serine acetyltransferase [Chitinophaga sp. SYP-B3965]|uniref:serine O-acetyltransferase n=1 Tax=Chitinophaga sp. SYP-B3965 TaxID=2663120 RepID=UPI001299D80F|nr:serine O-acetyltransferase [Chitinophaga sp. SYP-B3965]MRG48538.1 serine acetyltransferase [Chitinophaga sp. SYP-B3965]
MKQLLEQLKKRHRAAAADAYPSSEQVWAFCRDLVNWLFPEHTGRVMDDVQLEQYALQLETQLKDLLQNMGSRLPQDAATTSRQFMELVLGIYSDLTKDAEAILQGDPAATCLYEVIRAYPGFYAIAAYRVAHGLHNLEIPLLPRVITEFAHAKTGIDIHPAAVIAPYFCIDHGSGVVIGETTVIGQHVKLYQGVTLGALSIDKTMAQNKRHPTIEDHVVIYAGATILGGDTVIGHHSIIGGNVWLIKSTDPYSRIYYKADGSIKVV